MCVHWYADVWEHMTSFVHACSFLCTEHCENRTRMLQMGVAAFCPHTPNTPVPPKDIFSHFVMSQPQTLLFALSNGILGVLGAAQGFGFYLPRFRIRGLGLPELRYFGFRGWGFEPSSDKAAVIPLPCETEREAQLNKRVPI